MIRIIKEEPVTFGSRLNQLMKEKKIQNKEVAELLHCSKQTVSNWRTEKHTLRRHLEEYCTKLAGLLDVDPEYLMCTQLERRQHTALSEHSSHSSGLNKKWFNSVNGKMWNRYDSVQDKRRAMKEYKEDLQQAESAMKDRSEMLDVFSRMGITLESEIIGSGASAAEYEVLKDGVIYTLAQEEDHPRYSGNYAVTLPDGSQCTRTAAEVAEIYQSMKDFCIERFKW